MCAGRDVLHRQGAALLEPIPRGLGAVASTVSSLRHVVRQTLDCGLDRAVTNVDSVGIPRDLSTVHHLMADGKRGRYKCKHKRSLDIEAQ